MARNEEITQEDALKQLKIELSIWESDCKSHHKTKDALKVAIKTMEQQSNEDCVIINTNGLSEGIRCAMCTNHMKNDRGCDGGCVIDNDMYERVMNTIEKCIISKDV